MKPLDKNTEERILTAAREEFLERGFDGARMQSIADRAGINKALLHYYFRNKDKLFKTIFDELLKAFFPKIIAMMTSDKPIEEKVRFFVANYIDMLIANPHFPFFLFGELKRNPQLLVEVFVGAGGIDKKELLELFHKSIQQDVEAGLIRPVEAPELIINMLSLCAFPFLGKPLFQHIVFQNPDEYFYTRFLESRKKTVADFILQALRPVN